MANVATRIPSGHPEGFIEGFANIYRETADLIDAYREKKSITSLIPTVDDGLRGMRFIDKAVASNQAGSIWQSLDH